MEITPGWASAIIGSVGLVGSSIAAWLRSVDHAQAQHLKEISDTCKEGLNDVRSIQKTCFDKNDRVAADLQSYKLHVAETFVNREILKEQLLPIHKTLEVIQQELREDRSHPRQPRNLSSGGG